ncbi:MAG: FtsX-like permease family protein [Bacteroidales bacterium]|nr:FtsX-like permease family protein [Bacteroidales bacterium]
MRLEQLIAVRYLFARRQKSVVNVISWVSLIGLLVSTAALIVVLSVYNGIGEITKGLFSSFDPELIIEPTEGKTFRTADLDYGALCTTDGVEQVSQIVSETAWLTYADRQAIVTLRGVDENYSAISGLDTMLHNGAYQLTLADAPALIVGGEVFYSLGMNLLSNRPAAVHIPKRGTTAMGLTMDQAFNIGYAYPVASFFIQQDIDRRYVVTHIDLVRQLMDYAPDEVTALALKLRPGADPQKVKQSLRSSFITHHSSLTVKDRYDQQPLYFKIFRTERLGIYLILSLIVLISTLSLVASLSLLIINKRRDIFILRSMGMTLRQVRRAFATEGLLICGVAVTAGLLLGFVVCFLQQHFGIVRMGDGNFVVSAFPVAMRGVDFLATFLLVMVISGASVALTVHRRGAIGQ